MRKEEAKLVLILLFGRGLCCLTCVFFDELSIFSIRWSGVAWGDDMSSLILRRRRGGLWLMCYSKAGLG